MDSKSVPLVEIRPDPDTSIGLWQTTHEELGEWLSIRISDGEGVKLFPLDGVAELKTFAERLVQQAELMGE